MQPEEELLQAPHGDVEKKGQNGPYDQGLQQVSEEMKDGANDAQVIDEGVESHGKSNEPHGLGISGFWLFGSILFPRFPDQNGPTFILLYYSTKPEIRSGFARKNL